MPIRAIHRRAAASAARCAELDDRARLSLARLVLLLHTRQRNAIAAALDTPGSGFSFDTADDTLRVALM